VSVLGLDIGTSSVKGLLLTDEARIVGRARVGYRIRRPAPGWVEADAETVGRAAETVVRRMALVAEESGDPIRAVAACASGDEAVWVDSAGRPVAATIMSLDTRSTDEALRLARSIGRRRLYATTGLPIHPMYPLVRLIWLRRHDPAAFARVRAMLAWPEYLALRLGLEPKAEPTLAARTLAFDINRHDYDRDILATAGIGSDLFAPVVESGSIIGQIPRRIARLIGLRDRVALVAGGFDQTMATFGAAVSEPGVAHVGSGSWEAVTTLADAAVLTDRLRRSGFSWGPAVGSPARFTVMGSAGGGTILAWLRDLIAPRRSVGALVREAPDRPTTMLVLPHFEGSYSPWLDPASRGALVGLDLATDPGTIVRGVLEGITFELREQLERLGRAGIPVRELRASGGGARSRTWLQLKADVTNLPVSRVATPDSGALAVACLAASAIGSFETPLTAVRAAVRVDLVIEPRQSFVSAYAERFARHRRIYPTLHRWQAGDAPVTTPSRPPSGVDPTGRGPARSRRRGRPSQS